MFGLPELEVGVLGGVKFARRLVPELAAQRMFLTAERIPARDLVTMGAPISVVPHDDLEIETRALLARITDKSTSALRFAKQAMNAVEAMDVRAGYEYEQTFTVRMAARPESKEAVRAVLEKTDTVRRLSTDQVNPSPPAAASSSAVAGVASGRCSENDVVQASVNGPWVREPCSVPAGTTSWSWHPSSP